MATKDLIAKIVLKGETDPTLQKAFQNANKLADKNIQNLKKYGDAATKAMKFVGTAAVAGLGVSAKAAIDYESAFAGVMKTVNETGTTTYEDLSNQIRQMAKEMPASVEEIAAVAESAGQLGVKADDITGFTKTMIDLGETTNLSSDEAASAIAKLFNVTGTSMDKVDEFGSTLVALGNNAATTEADVMNMASRIASSGNQIGLTEPQILAMATSLSSVGLEAEAGGTAISTVMTKIDKSVAMNDETLSTWAKTAGMSVGNFKKMWESDAYGAMQKVIGGMGDVTKGGGNLNILLEDLGIKGIREADTMKRLASASGMMGDMTELANKAWGENSALTTEANTRYQTMASRMAIVKNKLHDVAITVGEALMPHIETLMTKIEGINFEAVADKIVSKIKWVADHFGLVAGAVGVFAGAFLTFKTANFINDVNDAVKAVKGLHEVAKKTEMFGKLKTALMGLPGVQGAITAAQSLMNITFMGCPVVWIVAGIAALVAAFVLLWKKCDWFRNFWIGLWDKIKIAASAAGAWLKNLFTVTIPNFIQTAIGFFQQLPAKIGYALGFAIGKVASWCVKLVQTARVKIPQFISAVVNFFKQLPSKIWTWLKNAVQKVQEWGPQLVAKGKAAATKLKDGVVNTIKNLPSKVKSIGKNLVTGLWKGITGAKDWLLGKIKSFASGVVKGFTNAFKINSPSLIMNQLVGKFLPMGIGEGITENAKYALSAVKDMGAKVIGAAQKISPAIGVKASGFASTASNINYANTAHALANGGKNILNRGIQGVSKASGGNNITFTFAPVVSGGNAEENRKMLKDEQAEFEKRMETWLKKNRRAAFA